MFQVFKSHRNAAPAAEPVVAAQPDLRAAVQSIGKQASTMGREVAEVRGQLDDTTKGAARQAQAVAALAGQLKSITNAQDDISGVTSGSMGAVARARQAVEGIGSEVSGINTTLVVRVTWVVAGALACMAGTMLALDVTLKPDLAFNIIIPIFAAAIVGGLGQAYGAIAGGLLIGFAESLAVFNWTMVLRPLNAILPETMQLPATLAFVPTEYKLTVAFVILVVVLLVKPTGIFKGASS